MFIATCAATLCFSPTLQVGATSIYKEQVPAALWTVAAPALATVEAPTIHTSSLPTTWIPTIEEQRVLKRALLRSVQIVHRGEHAV